MFNVWSCAGGMIVSAGPAISLNICAKSLRAVPEIICPECGKRLYHENETTLKIEETVHKKFCRKEDGKDGSYMHGVPGDEPIDAERATDAKGTPVLKR